ncbi:methionine--tRNA ligase [Candidatus Adlerbacteria bacterium RIFOXYC1_FULL_48_26]|uniref:Methionine--tRNA ligase n=1 Tax=Candidatus Adlerbacteria bacterium RIFOXYC1_FULL_48_26 TaxID=1797247 RepID=A0A1F4Y234_9BACT|nr:MAG: methionine--tRNA ligase [Candidatus Adlerbacteria bacterium RIFOXYC1_FULL_48_26]OGC94426.1 MAG: methionine--tRNA ligase [Candidatus Adlerbacteria bacterium RIFOXYB1_FULL_48_10]OGC95666.1 MAG: methionine--tRNA ligase [Candidatus Adlerbacteria bacterium RIFOXYD1_FULL_48_8]
MADKNFYLTTTLPYVNADPHIGFALELVQADITARYKKLRGSNVFFTTGTDEHGQKLYETAQKAGKDIQEYVDEYAAKFRGLKEKLGLYPELHFIRTTDPHHIVAAQEMWRRCMANGDIEKRTYKGMYCVGDEAFMKESELVNGRCPNHPNAELIELEEENYFFLLSKYQQKLTEYLSKEGVIVPEWRRQEALNFVQKGLEDFSISRVKEKMPWGIAVPDDETQVMYVWFDALTNYVSTLGWPDDAEGNFKTFWDNGFAMQMAGKDQVRFQSIMWQAMLTSAGIKNTDQVFYHGFITSGGQKMSKSIGNVIDPMTIVDEYGLDALRYFLARHVHPVDDSDVTLEGFKEAYNANLANGLGNLVSRVMTLATTHFTEPVELNQIESDVSVSERMEKFEFNRAMDAVWERIGQCDALITLKKPFSGIKSENPEEQEEARELMKKLVREIYAIACDLEPVMPETCLKIKTAVTQHQKPENLFARKD